MVAVGAVSQPGFFYSQVAIFQWEVSLWVIQLGRSHVALPSALYSLRRVFILKTSFGFRLKAMVNVKTEPSSEIATSKEHIPKAPDYQLFSRVGDTASRSVLLSCTGTNP